MLRHPSPGSLPLRAVRRAGAVSRRAVAVGAAGALAVACALTGGVIASVPATAATPQATQAAQPPVGPDGDAFYTPPSPLPDGKPGDVIWYRQVSTSAFLGVVSFSFSNAYKVLYRSTDTHGKPIAVSGIVLVPLFKDPAKLPIVGYAPGTQGVGDSCAPTRTIKDGLLYDQLYINGLVNRGFAVAVTDYEGLGTPGDHTYAIGRSEGHAVNDVVRASQRLAATKLSKDAPVAFTGYSQGGGAAGWAAELQPTYAPELKLKGVAAGGIPSDLLAVGKKLDGGPGFAFSAVAGVGLNAAYPELRIDSYLNDAGRALYQDVRKECVLGLLLKYSGHKTSQYTIKNPLDQPDWQARMKEQRLGTRAPKVPMYQWHASEDEMVDFGQADALHKTYCAAGVTLEWSAQSGNHLGVFLSGTPSAEQWIADRFAGKPATKRC